LTETTRLGLKLTNADEAMMAAVARLLQERGEPFPTRSAVIRFALAAALAPAQGDTAP
jgi:Arc/MetJ-type ribon-helix-helix transcriptional regulator